ncbi:hypothetical protein ACFXO7_00195 [Nocardia tengchongensis]
MTRTATESVPARRGARSRDDARAIADQLVHLVTESGAPVSGAILPAYGF